jgi:hypothetical protein
MANYLNLLFWKTIMNKFFVLMALVILINQNNHAADISNCKAGGMNMSALAYAATDLPYNDVTKMASPWYRVAYDEQKNGKKPIDLDSEGYPKTVDISPVASLISADKWGRDYKKESDYVLLYDGEGEVTFGLERPTIIKQEPGRMLVKFDARESPFNIILNSSNPANHVRNIRLIPPAFETSEKQQLFRQSYVDKWSKFPVWRLLVIGSMEPDWDTRLPKNYFGPGRGMPVEDMVALANQAQISPWISIPFNANDNLVLQTAKYVKDNLDPKLKVYLEYTNEAWNAGFPQFAYMAEQGKKMSPFAIDGAQYFADRTLNIFKIWEQAFEGKTDRLVRIVGTQFVNTWLSDRLLSWKDLAKHTDALAVGYYFGYEYGADLAEKTIAMTTEQLLDDIKVNGLARTREFLQAQKKIADKYKVSLIAYEAGQHLVGSGYSQALKIYLPDHPKLQELFNAANKHPKMGEIYKEFYKDWHENGGGLIAWFESTGERTKWGSWGLLENGGQDIKESPKLQAVIDYQNSLSKSNIDDCKLVAAPNK